MKTPDQINISENFGLLIQGPPKTGKTELALAFPRPWIANADNNLIGFEKRCREQDVKPQWFYSDIYRDDTGKPIEDKEAKWNRFKNEVSLACKSPDIDTIVLDSMTTLCQILCEALPMMRYKKTGKGSQDQMEIQDWMSSQNIWKEIIMRLRGSGKILVVLCHEEAEKDEISGGVTKWKPNIPGSKLQSAFSGFFSDVWRTEVETDKDGKSNYIVRTRPTARLDLGGSVSTATQTFIRPNSILEQQKLIWDMIGYKAKQ